MNRLLYAIAAAAIVLVVAAIGCPNRLDTTTGLTSPSTTPSSATVSADPITMSAVTGAWTLADAPAAASSTSSGCSKFDYTVTPSGGGGSAVVRFTATCPTFQLTGGGAAILSGSRLAWTASGTATRGALTCPFSLERSTLTPEGSGTTEMRVIFSGTVCGLPATGNERLRRSN